MAFSDLISCLTRRMKNPISSDNRDKPVFRRCLVTLSAVKGSSKRSVVKSSINHVISVDASCYPQAVLCVLRVLHVRDTAKYRST